MLLRVLIAGLFVFGGFVIVGWVVAPAGWGGSILHKGDRLSASSQAAPTSAMSSASEPASGTKLVPTTTFRPTDGGSNTVFQPPDRGLNTALRPPDGAFNTALLTPGITTVPPPAALASAPLADPAPIERQDPRKPFRCPRGTPAAVGPPTSTQIAQIKTSLRLTQQQEKFWGPVERALMEIARHFENPSPDARRSKSLLSVERMQQIYWTAGPLVMSLREEQKRDVRRLACGMGLAAVAALI
jgi:hypothetical protein